jgi:hypothetical protein
LPALDSGRRKFKSTFDEAPSCVESCQSSRVRPHSDKGVRNFLHIKSWVES